MQIFMHSKRLTKVIACEINPLYGIIVSHLLKLPTLDNNVVVHSNIAILACHVSVVHNGATVQFTLVL